MSRASDCAIPERFATTRSRFRHTCGRGLMTPATFVLSAVITTGCRRNGFENDNTMSRIPSTLSVTAVDVVVACQPSPSHSILTLTPGRTRNIDQDMEALRLSRQDNPFLQVRFQLLHYYPIVEYQITRPRVAKLSERFVELYKMLVRCV